MTIPHSDSGHQLTYPLVGVRFVWTDVKARLGPDIARDDGVLHGRILAVATEHMKRQKRTRVEYWDALTFLDRGTPAPEIAERPEGELVIDLIHAVGAGKPLTQKVRALIELPFFRHVDSRLAYHKGPSDHRATQAAVRTYGDRLTVDAQGRSVPRAAGFFRELTVWMDGPEGLGMRADALELSHLLVLAVLVQLRADLEVFYATGFMRPRRCDRHACGGWFGTKRMAARQRFCSTYCRVAHAQQKAGSVG